MVEVFTNPGTNLGWCKAHITQTTGFVPVIYDKGTHYVTNMRQTLDILKRLDVFEFVEDVTGDYTGTLTALGASHEPRSQPLTPSYYTDNPLQGTHVTSCWNPVLAIF